MSSPVESSSSSLKSSASFISNSSSSSQNSYDCSYENEISIDSMDLDFDPKTRKLTDEELKPQPILKKAKKVW